MPAPGTRAVEVDTPVGPARLHVHPARAALALVVLGHGAGRGVDTADLLGLARDLPDEGVTVVLVDQPRVVAGRTVTAAPAQLDLARTPYAGRKRERCARVSSASPGRPGCPWWSRRETGEGGCG